MKCYKGSIVTVNENNDVFQYLVEDNGIIIFVGNELPKMFQDAKMIDLKNCALIPAFVDTHQHLASFATFHAGLNVMEADSNQEIANMISEFVREAEGNTLIAFGASPYSVKEQRLISREELDHVCPDRELMVVKYDGHACIINSKLLSKIDEKVRNLRGYHPESGEMNQEAFFEVSNYITNALPIPELFENMQKAVDFQASKGIGCIHTVSGVGFPLNADITMEQVFAKSLSNGFQIRVFPQSMNVKTATRRKLSRIGGCFECALDGCFGSHDASLLNPYVDENGGDGILYYSDEQVSEFCKKANRAGLQIELHAIGDKAFDQASRAIKAALDDYPRVNHRHGIIHACLPTKDGINICREYKISLAVQSAFIDWRQEPDEYLEEILGVDRAKVLNPIRTFLDNEIVVGLGSDAPCTSPDPIAWIDKAVNHPVKEYAITIQAALKTATYNGYFIGFDEQERGSLEVGKTADMVILSSNPYEINKEEIKNLKVKATILNGKKYKSCQENIYKAALRGILSNKKV